MGEIPICGEQEEKKLPRNLFSDKEEIYSYRRKPSVVFEARNSGKYRLTK